MLRGDVALKHMRTIAVKSYVQKWPRSSSCCTQILKEVVDRVLENQRDVGGDLMSDGGFQLKKAFPIIIVTWVLSLITTLAIAYFVPFSPITSDKVLDGAIITTKLADGTVTTAKIVDGTITAVDLASGAVITVNVADGAITTEKIADGNVTTNDLADNAIVTVKLADGSVTSAKILDASITAIDIGDGEITSIKIADGAITTSKIADSAVTSLKLAAYAIPFNTTYVSSEASTTSTALVDMPNTFVTLNIERNSTLIVMFSAEARATAGDRIYASATVNGTSLTSNPIYFTPANATSYGSYSYTFTYKNATPGFYSIQMMWRVNGVGVGFVYYRTLTVIALPT